MGIIVGVFGESGEGKTTSNIVNPDGKYDFSKEGYKGMCPKSHMIINLDNKKLPIPGSMWSIKNKNYVVATSFELIKKTLEYCAKTPEIKSVAIDTINLYLAMKEFNERKKMSFDNWKDIANDIIELNTICNTVLREDQVAYIFGHTMMMTDQNGEEKKVLSVIGKKLQRTPPEAFYPIVIMTRIDWGLDGDNNYLFQTKANKSSAKTPIGMFDEFEVPNSLALIDQKVREYYGLEENKYGFCQ